jgi:hypothetical protein
MSKKFAGSLPYYIIRSIVAIANPAPLTRHAIFPSKQILFRLYADTSTSLGSSSPVSCDCAMSGCRMSALSSKLTVQSMAEECPSFVKTNGLISINEQSLEMKNWHRHNNKFDNSWPYSGLEFQGHTIFFNLMDLQSRDGVNNYRLDLFGGFIGHLFYINSVFRRNY